MKRLLFLLCLLPNVAFGASENYYISQNSGSDANSGTAPDQAKQTLNGIFGSATINQGDTVFIGPGRYDESGPGGDHLYSDYLEGSLYASNIDGKVDSFVVIRDWPDSARPEILGHLPSGCNYPPDCGAEGWNGIGIELWSTKFIKFLNIVVKHAARGYFFCHDSAVVFENCVAESIYADNGAPLNWGGFFIEYDNSPVTSHHTQEVRFVRCSVKTAYRLNSTVPYSVQTGTGGNGGGIMSYNALRYKIDSCYFTDTPDAIYFKGRCDSSRARWNHFYNVKDGLFIAAYSYADTVAFNLFDGFTSGIHYESHTDKVEEVNDMWAFNNTFYRGTGACVAVVDGFSTSCIDKANWFNNIFSKATYGISSGCPTGEDYPEYCDYNFYATTLSTSDVRWDEANRTLAQWQSIFDFDTAGGQNGDPEFEDTTESGGRDFHLQAGSPCETGGRGGSYKTYMGAFDPNVDICVSIQVNSPINNDTIDDYTPTLDIDLFDTDGDESDVVLLWGDEETPPVDTLADTSIVADDDWLYTMPTLTENHNYYVRWIACDTAGCCDTSAIFKFTVDSIPPVVAGTPLILYGTKIQGVKLQ